MSTNSDVNAALRRLQGEVDRLTEALHMAESSLGKLYYHVTNGRASKPYLFEDMESVVDDCLTEMIGKECEPLNAALAASQAECAALREALEGVAKGDDELRIGGVTAWFQPKDNTPWSGVPTAVVDAARAILSRPPGSREALDAAIAAEREAWVEAMRRIFPQVRIAALEMVDDDQGPFLTPDMVERLIAAAIRARGKEAGDA